MDRTITGARRFLLAATLLAAGLGATACSSDSDEEATATEAAGTVVATAAATEAMTATEAAPAVTIEVADIRARATPGLDDENSAAYALITNTGTETDRLVGASVDASIAKRAELHETVTQGDMMQMVQVEGWDIEPGATLELAPGANHIMFIGIAKQFVVGDSFTLTLVFEHAGEIEVEVPVMEIAASSMGGGAGASATPMR